MKAAIYSRKSVFTGKGESIDNQIQMCKKYYSNICLGKVDFEIYEDEGYSGANTKRPEFQRLLKDIKCDKFSALICYRLDRISRNVADFSSILELLQLHNVAFISIKEQFDTTTPIGKAMVYIASVFAQLERDTIAERIKDNMLELSKTGRWLGGQLPLGFTGKKITYLDNELKERSMHALSPISTEMNLIKNIYTSYLKYNSIKYVLKEVIKNNQKGKNGGDFSSMSIRDILRNPVYVKSSSKVKTYLESKGILFCGIPDGCGIMLYNKKAGGKRLNPTTKWIAAVGKHKGIISSSDWLKVQEIMDQSFRKKESSSIRLGTSKKAVLTGLLRCAKCGSPMRVIYGRTKKDGSKKYYYACTLKCNSGKTLCNNSNINGEILDYEVLKKLSLVIEDEKIITSKKELKQQKDILDNFINLNKSDYQLMLIVKNLLNRLIEKILYDAELNSAIIYLLNCNKKIYITLKK